MNTPLPSATETMLAAKKAKNLTFAQIGELLGADETWVASVFYRQSTLSPAQAKTLSDALELDDQTAATLTDYPTKGLGPIVPTDPMVYRFYEITQIYGLPLKAVIQEKFGDGIMSAVDFSLTVDKQEDPKGDRVIVTMNGKFLSYKQW